MIGSKTVRMAMRRENGFSIQRSRFYFCDEHVILDDVVYSFSFEFTKLLTLFKPIVIFNMLCFVVNMPYILLMQLFLDVKRKSEGY